MRTIEKLSRPTSESEPFSFSHRIDGNSKANELNKAAFTIVAKASTREGLSEPSLSVPARKKLKPHKLALIYRKNHNENELIYH